jgi:hypothetical protein
MCVCVRCVLFSNGYRAARDLFIYGLTREKQSAVKLYRGNRIVCVSLSLTNYCYEARPHFPIKPPKNLSATTDLTAHEYVWPAHYNRLRNI